MPGTAGDPIPLYGDVEALEYHKYSVKADSGVIVKDKLLELYMYQFNNEGDVITNWVWWTSGNATSQEYKYEYIGNRLDCIKYNAQKQIIGKNTYRYDLNGNMIERITYDSAGMATDSFNATFDFNGNMIAYKSGNYEEYSKYDEYGNIIEQTAIYKKSGSRNTYTYKNKYNASGNLVEKRFYARTGEVFPEIYKYDSAGNLIEYARYSWDGSLIQCYLYTYDDFGNMIGYQCGEIQIRFQYDSRGNIINYSYNNENINYIVEFKIYYR